MNRVARHTRLFFTVAAVLCLVAPASVSAQLGILVGRVVDEAGTPVPGAEVRVGGVDATAQSDNDGWFRVRGVRTGLFYFGVRRVGYRPASDMLRFTGNDTVDVTVERISPELDTVKVQARADAQFERDLRRYEFAVDAARFGVVITEDDIARRRPIYTTDLIQNLVGFRVIGDGPRARLQGTRSGCSPALFIDGMYTPGFNINDIAPEFIKLVIAYRGLAGVPPQFQNMRADSSCGTIALITM